MTILSRQSLPLDIYSVESVRAMDRRAIEEAGIPGYELMTRAGDLAARECLRSYPRTRRWQVVCGPGNNGGDGYVAARIARRNSIDVRVYSIGDPAALKGDAARACQDWMEAGGRVQLWDGALDDAAELSLDAVFGSGLARPVEGLHAQVLEALNAHPAPVVALDMPSGIHGDSGECLGTAVRADRTITFVGLKTGLFLREGLLASGHLGYGGLDIPEACRTPERPILRRIGRRAIAGLLPARRRDAHKGDFGHVLVIGGGPGMPGAARLCGEAALRSGAGKVSVATHASHADSVAATRPELMVHAVSGPASLLPLLDGADVVAFGPGLGASDWAKSLYRDVVEFPRAAVWDADALNLLAGSVPSAAGAARDARVLTPHPGEAGRLLGLPAATIQKDRVSAVASLAQRFGGVAVLKGAGTLIATGNDVPYLCTAGNPGMATAGMGDVLTGIIAGLLAQGLTPVAAAVAGVQGHAMAGDRAAAPGLRGMLASDVLAELRAVLNPGMDTTP